MVVLVLYKVDADRMLVDGVDRRKEEKAANNSSDADRLTEDINQGHVK
jgi:hypothetical protein